MFFGSFKLNKMFENQWCKTGDWICFSVSGPRLPPNCRVRCCVSLSLDAFQSGSNFPCRLSINYLSLHRKHEYDCSARAVSGSARCLAAPSWWKHLIKTCTSYSLPLVYIHFVSCTCDAPSETSWYFLSDRFRRVRTPAAGSISRQEVFQLRFTSGEARGHAAAGETACEVSASHHMQLYRREVYFT